MGMDVFVLRVLFLAIRVMSRPRGVPVPEICLDKTRARDPGVYRCHRRS